MAELRLPSREPGSWPGSLPRHDAGAHWESGSASTIFLHAQTQSNRSINHKSRSLFMANKEQNRKVKTNKPKLTTKEKQAKKLAANQKK
jgi:hypothetical protein